MRFRFAALFASCALLGSCAYQGVVVDKTSRELPFSDTVGAPGSFAFMLRDASGVVHRQLVTPEVFASYNVGDYFNDLQPAGGGQPGSGRRQNVADDKVVLTASGSARQHYSPIASAPSAKAATNVVVKPTPKATAKLAKKETARSRKSHRSVAAKKRASHRAALAKAKQKAKTATPAFSTKPTDVDIVDVGGGSGSH